MNDLPDPLSTITWLHHFTDTRNLPSIRSMGGLYSRYHLEKRGSTEYIPGGNQVSLDADVGCGMDKYVHLCMTTTHPLQYLATNDGRISKTLWLYVEAARVFEIEGVLFSHGVSNRNGVRICPIREASPEIDLEVLQKHMDWRIPEIRARRSHAELCEVLVPEHVPIKYFERFLPNG